MLSADQGKTYLISFWTEQIQGIAKETLSKDETKDVAVEFFVKLIR